MLWRVQQQVHRQQNHTDLHELKAQNLLHHAVNNAAAGAQAAKPHTQTCIYCLCAAPEQGHMVDEQRVDETEKLTWS